MHLYGQQDFTPLLLMNDAPPLGFKKVELENTMQDNADRKPRPTPAKASAR